jgi:uncharacterized membrane protein YedE/YeeE
VSQMSSPTGLGRMLPLASFLIGVLFSLGLGLSGMTDPNRVKGFLDVFGSWDPSLIFVMGSAIPVYFAAWQIYKKRHIPFFDVKSHVPSRKDIDRKLIVGSAIFGVGWGLAGICPGPGIAGLGVMSVGAAVFVIGFVVGAWVESILDAKF